jgi:hypothetical protein
VTNNSTGRPTRLNEGNLLTKGWPPAPLPLGDIIEAAPPIGPPTAISFEGDFECPFCGECFSFPFFSFFFLPGLNLINLFL